MNCGKCGAQMQKCTLTNGLHPLLLTNKKKGWLEPEKRSTVSCYACSECGYIELYADRPQDLKLDPSK